MEPYVVKNNDTLYTIARRFSTSVDSLVHFNQLQDPDLLTVGQALVIPDRETFHTVRRGETLFSIARSHGVALQRLIAANPQIPDPNSIFPGMSVRIPANTQDPGPIQVNGYISDTTEETLRETLPYLSTLSPFSYRAELTGDLTPEFRVDTELSSEYRVANLMTVTNLRAQGGFSSEIAHAVLTASNVQERFLSRVEDTLLKTGYAGINLDFEYVYPFDREIYNQFLRRLTDRMHFLGFLVVTALAPKLNDDQQGLLYAAHDYAFHGKTADYVVLMTYEWGYTYGPAMAVAPINMVRRVLDYAVSRIPAGKILLGIPNYGYNWTLPFVQGTAARPLTNTGAVALAGQVHAAIQYDETAQAPFFRYYDGNRKEHEVWFEDARSLRAKYLLVKEYGLAGISFWNLNSLFRTAFLVLESLYSVEKLV